MVEKLIAYARLDRILSTNNPYILKLTSGTKAGLVQELDTLLGKLGFDTNIRNYLISDSELWYRTRDIVSNKLREWKENYIKTPKYESYQARADSYRDWDFSPESLSLFERLFLSVEKPDVIRILEERLELPETGNHELFLQNYARKYYTRSCMMYHRSDFCLLEAIKNDDLEIFRLALKSQAPNYVAGLETLAALGSSLSHDQLEMLTILIGKADKNMIDLDYPQLMATALEYGHRDVFERLAADAEDKNYVMELIHNQVKRLREEADFETLF